MNDSLAARLYLYCTVRIIVVTQEHFCPWKPNINGPLLQDSSGMTLVMLAAAGGHDDILRLLIWKGAKVNCRQKNGTTALIHAAEKVGYLSAFFSFFFLHNFCRNFFSQRAWKKWWNAVAAGKSGKLLGSWSFPILPVLLVVTEFSVRETKIITWISNALQNIQRHLKHCL